MTVRCSCLDGEPAEIVADYAIAALGSTARELRRQLGVTFDGRSFEDKFLICDIRADIPGWATERRFCSDPEWNPGRQVLIHPCPDSTFRIDWQVPGDYDLEAEEASGALDARIRQIIGDPAASTYVDSGRLAEPFWYVDSPLTTPHPSRTFAGRPPKGEVPDPVPGVLLPDVPVTVPGIRADRVRELARYGILFLTGPAVDKDIVRGTALEAIKSPLRIHAVADIDSSGTLTEALEPEPTDVWIVRPDSYIAAVVDARDAQALRTALQNTIAAPGSEAARVPAEREVPPGPPREHGSWPETAPQDVVATG